MDCNCNTKENCLKNDCSCPIKDFPTSCLIYDGLALECSSIDTNQPFNEVIEQLDKYICDKFTLLVNSFQLINIGGEKEVYKGVNILGQRQMRTFVAGDTNLVVIQQLEDTIEVDVDEEGIITLIEDNESTYSVNNVGDGIGVYKDSTTVGNNTQFNLKGIVSDSLTLTEEEDSIRIESAVDLGGVRDFIVNTRYTGDEELGTEAKPFKNLDNAVVAYIGSGSRLSPEFQGSRILCKGGQTHNFTEDLSIAGLILEVEVGTSIRYVGSDLYPIDFRTLQTASGGYSTQSKSIPIKVQGGGNFLSDNLFAYVVSSGHLVTDPTRLSNSLTLDDIRIYSYYKEDEFQSGITRSDLSPWITNTREADFFFGGVEEAVIVLEGQSLTNAIADNNNTGHLITQNVKIFSLTQQGIEINSAYCRLIESSITNNLFNGKVIADDSALVGTVLTEDPLLSYNLPDFKPELCLAELNGIARLFIEGGNLTTGFEITENEAWYKVNSDDAAIIISDAVNPTTTGAIKAENFIETGAFEPNIRINGVFVAKSLENNGTLINSSVITYANAEVNNNNFNFGLADNIDLTQSNNNSVVNVFEGKIKESLQVFSSRFQAVDSGGLTQGDIFINEKSVTAGSFVVGVEYRIQTIGSTDFTAIGASSNTVGEYFTATGTGTGTGTASYNIRDIIT